MIWIALLPILIIGFVFVVLALTLGPFLIRLLRNASMERQVMQTGMTATATIVRTWDTGVRINGNPQVGMELAVQPATGAPFTAQATHTVSIIHLAMYQPGALLQVRYDPANPSRVAIAGVMTAAPPIAAATAGATAATGGMNAQQAEAMLKQIDAANEQLIATGQQAMAKVIQYQPMGIDVNGTNPAVTLWLEVQPLTGPKFNAQAQGVIAVASVARYQPGQMITVRYDPNDLTKVAIEHSGV